MFDLGPVADGIGQLNHHIGVWENFGYHNPPSPDATKVRPLGQRTASAIAGAHAAIGDVDSLIANLTTIKDQLVAEIRQDEDWRRPTWTVQDGEVV